MESEVTKEAENGKKAEQEKNLPRVNFRVVLFAALFLSFGIFLYYRILFREVVPSDFFFLAVFLLLALPPRNKRRLCLLLALAVVFTGAGVLVSYLSTLRYSSLAEEGNYTVTATVERVAIANGVTEATLGDLCLDEVQTGGKAQVRLPTEELRAGDLILLKAKLTPVSLSSRYAQTQFSRDVRYRASATSFRWIGKSRNPFLLLDSAIYDTLHENMERDEADVCYALLLGNSSGMDSGLLTAIRYGGIAHIFAVSGLHIGILYGAVRLLFRKIGKWKELPALLFALLYTALCSFSPSSVRALIMCAAISLTGAFGRKADYLSVIGFAAFCILLFRPEQWLLAGFRLSFGACLGLALFSGGISRLFFFLPRFLRSYLSSCLAVLLFTFPIQMEAFGYLSFWGLLLNFFLIPALPFFFLGLILFTLFALVIPPAAAVLAVPGGLVTLLLLLFSWADFSLVLTGFSLGAGSAVYLVFCLVMSERVRFRLPSRVVCSSLLALLFTLLVLFENAVFVGVKVIAKGDDASLVYVQTAEAKILIIGENATLRACNDFLSRRVWGNLDVAVVLAEEEMKAINVAAFTGAKRIYAYRELATGLRETEICFSERFTAGGVRFSFESAHKLSLYAENVHAEVDFTGEEALSSDLFLDGKREDLTFFLQNGIIKEK